MGAPGRGTIPDGWNLGGSCSCVWVGLFICSGFICSGPESHSRGVGRGGSSGALWVLRPVAVAPGGPAFGRGPVGVRAAGRLRICSEAGAGACDGGSADSEPEGRPYEPGSERLDPSQQKYEARTTINANGQRERCECTAGPHLALGDVARCDRLAGLTMDGKEALAFHNYGQFGVPRGRCPCRLARSGSEPPGGARRTGVPCARCSVRVPHVREPRSTNGAWRSTWRTGDRALRRRRRGPAGGAAGVAPCGPEPGTSSTARSLSVSARRGAASSSAADS